MATPVSWGLPRKVFQVSAAALVTRSKVKK